MARIIGSNDSPSLCQLPLVFGADRFHFRLIPGFSDGRGLNPVFCEFVSQTAGLTPLIRFKSFILSLSLSIFSGVVNPFLYSFFGNVFIQDLEKIKFTLFRKIPSLGTILAFCPMIDFVSSRINRKRASFEDSHKKLWCCFELKRRVSNQCCR